MFDLVVVGAGPAGAIAARDAARAGGRVALVDGSHPREKVCGGGVTGRALALVGCADAGVPSRAIAAAVFEAGGRSVRVSVDAGESLRVYARAPLDASIVRQAQAAGALTVGARVTRLERDGKRWRIHLSDEDAIAGRWVLGADGACGVARKQLFRPFTRAQLSVAAGSFVDGVTSHDVCVAFVDRPVGYFWSFPRPDHLAAGACADATTPEAMHAITDAWLEGYAPAAGKPRRRYAWPIPSLGDDDFDLERVSGPGWMLAGDAAGLVDPITREGIYFALRSGQLAAEAVATADPARTYDAALRAEIHPDLRRAARLKRAFFQPRFTRLLVEALEQSAPIRAVMVDLVAGRQSYRTLKRRLLGTLELPLLWKLLRSEDL